MEIKDLIAAELADTAVHQARWQAIVKQIILEEGPANRERIMVRIKEAATKIGTRITKRAVGLGMDWLAEGKP